MLVVRHVLNRHDHRDNTLVTVTTRHLVAWLDTTLHREINFNNLENAGSKVITTLELLFLCFKTLFE